MVTQRRLDRILQDEYLAHIEDAPADELRRMRDECAQEESDLSYARRLLQGKIDIVRGELSRRSDAGVQRASSLLEQLPSILGADAHASGTPGVRFTGVGVPPAAQFGRRELDAMLEQERLGDLGTRNLDELEAVVERLVTRERELSDLRRSLLDRLNRIQDELTSRYKSGSASIGDVLGRSN